MFIDWRLNIYKLSDFPKLIYIVTTISIKIPEGFVIELLQLCVCGGGSVELIQKHMCKWKAILRKNEVRGHILPDTKTYSKALQRKWCTVCLMMGK